MTTLIHVARRSGRMTLRTLKLVSWVYGIIVLVVLLTDPQLLKSGTFGPEWYSITTAIGTLVTLGLAVFAAVIAAGFAFFDTRGARVKERKASTSVLAAGLINLAVLLAGRRRAHVREAWQGDLERPRDPADEPDISVFAKLAYAAGLVRAGIRYRIDDAALLWWRLADGVLASRSWSRLLLISPCATAVIAIVHVEGLYGLVINAENLLAIGTVSAGLVYGGRKARKVALKPARREQDQR